MDRYSAGGSESQHRSRMLCPTPASIGAERIKSTHDERKAMQKLAKKRRAKFKLKNKVSRAMVFIDEDKPTMREAFGASMLSVRGKKNQF